MFMRLRSVIFFIFCFVGCGFVWADSVLVFNEIMYHPATNEAALDWIELHNQLAVNLDVSEWGLQRGVDYSFPVGTVVEAGEYLVIASSPETLETVAGISNVYGPFSGRLSNGGETLELINNTDRVMDSVKYGDDDDWPVSADGSGASLAKIDPQSASPPFGNWSSSYLVGGTPGEQNFTSLPTFEPRISFNEVSAASNGFWLELINYDDHSINLSNFVIRCSGASYDFNIPAIELDSGECVVFSNMFQTYLPQLGDKLFLYSADGNYVLDGTKVNTRLKGKYPDGTGNWMYPVAATPAASNLFLFQDDIVINEIMYNHREIRATPGSYLASTNIQIDSVWRYNQSGTDLGTAWREKSFDDSGWPSGNALLYVEGDPLPAPKNTLLTLGQTTYYFRTSFIFTGNYENVNIKIHPIIDDGAVFYLNGEEEFRLGMPDGEITHGTFATNPVNNATYTGPFDISTNNLIVGTNVMAVEVHQHAQNSSDIVFGMLLYAQKTLSEPVPYSESQETWVELYNRGTNVTDLSGWQFNKGISYVFPPGTALAPDEYVVVAKETNLMAKLYPSIRIFGNFSGKLSRSGERVRLIDNFGNPADEIRYMDGPPWPEYADGGGSSIELRDPYADNSFPEVWAASDESTKLSWKNYAYRGVAGPSSLGDDAQWQELVIGLLDEGEVLLDDISVVEDPDGSDVELVPNGTFDIGPASWRIIGNHRHSDGFMDPENPGNYVLRLVATGPTEHMHNHAETTLLSSISNGLVYKISFRAKWLAGSEQLNIRLYFNRLGRTILLDVPEKNGTPGAQNSTFETNIGPVYKNFRHFPAVPSAGKPVTVSVFADDNDGVSGLTNWYSVNGGAWVATAMTLSGDNKYSVTIPGQSFSSIIHFYVEGYDNFGASSTFPAGGKNARALYEIDGGEAAVNGRHNIRIVMIQEDDDFLHANIQLMSNDRIGATVIYNETDVFYNVGVRLKGSERGRPVTARLGFNVRFNKDKLFRGIHQTVAIDRSEGTGFGQREILINHVMNKVGHVPNEYNDLIKVIAPRSAHTSSAELQLSRFRDEFLENQFKNGGEGEVFEYDLIYYPLTTDADGYKRPNPDGAVATWLRGLGNDKEDYRWIFLIKNNRFRDDYSRLMDCAKLFSLSGSAFNDQVENIIDVDQWLRSFAVGNADGGVDHYICTSPHNAQFYVRPEDNRVLLFPHDMDYVWGYDQQPLLPNTPSFQKLIQVPEYLRRYYGYLYDVLTTAYNHNYMSYWTTHYGSLLPYQNFGTHLTYIYNRYNYLMGLLSAQVGVETPFSITTTNCTVDTLYKSVVGSAWINVDKIKVDEEELSLDWPAMKNWETEVQLVPGTNHLVFVAHDFQNYIIATDEITIISLATDTSPKMVINEFLARNESQGSDEFGEFDDWVELYNCSTNAAELGGMFLSDDIFFPAKWPVPTTNILPENFLVLWADEDTNQGPYHMTFKLSGVGETISLYNPETVLVHRITFGEQFTDISFGLFPDGNTSTNFFLYPTVGTNNILPEPGFIWIIGLLVPLLSGASRACLGRGWPIGRG